MGKGHHSEEHRVCPCQLKIGQCWVISLLCVHLFCGERIWLQDCSVCGVCFAFFFFFTPPLLLFPIKSIVLSLLCVLVVLISEPKLSTVEGLWFFVWSCPVDVGEKLILFSWAWKNALITLFPKPFLVTKFISCSNKFDNYNAYTKIFLLEL